MVGRFESTELKRDALAHEELCASHGLLGVFACLIGLVLTAIGLLGMVSPLVSIEAFHLPLLFSRAALPPAPSVSESTGYEAVTYSSWGSTTYPPSSSYVDYGLVPPPPAPEVGQMHVDLSLVAVLVTILAICALPPMLRGQPQESWATQPPAGQAPNRFALSELLGGAGRGRLIDVKPGELQGSMGGSFGYDAGPWGATPGLGGQAGYAPWHQAGMGTPMDWTASPNQWGTGMGVASGMSPGVGVGVGSWNAPVPSPYGTNLPPPSSYSFRHAQATGAANLEAEVQETYATFGGQMQQWVQALAAMVDQEIIAVLLQQLDESDQLWQQALASRGWRLTTELPQLSGPGGYGLGMGVRGSQEISVFDRHLPKPWCDDTQAAQAWQKRLQLEDFLAHPSYGPTTRQYVLERLRDWRHRGVLNGMRHDEWRPNGNMPTDAHILENLIFKMLKIHLDFCDCFLAAGASPPFGRHMGQAPTAFLRETTNQALTPKPAPHYEVVVLQKVWRLRPGNRNLMEALALLMHQLRKHSRSYNSFPQVLRGALEGRSGVLPWLPGLQDIYSRFF